MNDRIHSRNPAHLKEDLAAALDAALDGDLAPDRKRTVEKLVESLWDHHDAQSVLRDVLASFGSQVFGAVALFSMQAETSLAGHAEALTSPPCLKRMSLTVRDLGWPEDVLSPFYEGNGVEWDPGLKARFSAAVTRWRETHPAAA